ncbi:MAG: resuscitation-promoting factor RpfA [Actinomycetota bacterium]|nr:resuscitation-promoting factor RpfA [Actinomycetota bacterium]
MTMTMTMAKIRVLVWTASLLVAARLLLVGVRTPTFDEPAVAMMWVVRLVAGGLAVYLLVATVLAIRLPRLAPRFVRQLVATGIGAGMLVAPMAASATPSSPPPVDAPVLRRLPDAQPPAFSEAPPPHAAVNDAENAREVVTVVAGDHLWAIAERALGARLGRAPSDAEIVPFWTSLIEMNRARLANPADPSLIFAGQELELP